MMTKEELITVIAKERSDIIEYINSKDYRCLEELYKYDGYVEKLLEADLSMGDVGECFSAMMLLYMIKHDIASCLSDMRIATYSALFDLSWHVFNSLFDLKAAYKDAKERAKRQDELGIVVEKKKTQPWKTAEERKIEEIVLLESIIGEQSEFNTIMGR